MTLNLKNAKSYGMFFLFFLTIFIFSSCKKKEERDLIKNYVGKYLVVRESISCCDSNWHTTTNQDTIELEVKKSIKGIKIKDVAIFDNFEVDYKDSTIWADDKHSYAVGKFYPNDSIFLDVSITTKVPNSVSYRMKKIY